DETTQHQNIKTAGAVRLEREMNAATADVARRRQVRDGRAGSGAQERAGLGFGHHVELVPKALRQRLEVALGGRPIAAEQEITDEVSGIHLAERIERNEPAGVRGCGRVVAGRIPILHHALERLDRPAPQGLAAKERPLVELRRVARRKALKEVAQIKAAGRFKLPVVARLLGQLRVHLQVDRSRPWSRRRVSGEHVIAERELEPIQQAPQPRPHNDGKSEEIVDADLVVDATGRGSSSATWLEELGYQLPANEKVEIG